MCWCVRLGGSHFQHLKHEDREGDAHHARQGSEYHAFRKDLAHDVPWLAALDTVKVLLDVLEETTLTISTIDAQ